MMKPGAAVLLAMLYLFVMCEMKRGWVKADSSEEDDGGPWWMTQFKNDIRDELGAQQGAVSANITADIAAKVADLDVSLTDQLAIQQDEIETNITDQLAAQREALEASFVDQLATQQDGIEASIAVILIEEIDPKKSLDPVLSNIVSYDSHQLAAQKEASVIDQLATQQGVLDAIITSDIAAKVADLNVSLTDQLGGTMTSENDQLGGTMTSENGSDTSLPRDCEDIYDMGDTTTGEYVIYPINSNGFAVRCDMDTTSGGWTVIQRRVSNSNFYRDWSEYETGFGDLATNFWLGLRQIYAITHQDEYTLRIDMENGPDDRAMASYSEFYVGDASSKYCLHVDGFAGSAGDGLSDSNGKKFSTKDQDNDIHPSLECAHYYAGAWWYNQCGMSNLNGGYGSSVFLKGVNWQPFAGHSVSLTKVEMKVKRADV